MLPKVIWTNCIGEYMCAVCITRLSGVSRWFRDLFRYNQRVTVWSESFKQKNLANCLSTATHQYRNCDCIVRLLIAKGADVRKAGLEGACINGNPTIVDFIITHGANDWNTGMAAACRNGHMWLVKLMISRGANDWDWGLVNACRNGSKEIVELMVKNGATDFNMGLDKACKYNHTDIGKLMIVQCGANHFNTALSESCYRGNRELIDLMIKHGAGYWNGGLAYAAAGGHIDIARLMISKGATDFNWAFQNACQYGQTDMVQFLMTTKCDSTKIRWDGCLRLACRAGCLDLVKLIIEKCDNGTTDFTREIELASAGGHTEIVQFLTEK